MTFSNLTQACKSLDHTHAGYISIDHEAHISYYSNRSPEQPELYSVVRQACVRRYSCFSHSTCVCRGGLNSIFGLKIPRQRTTNYMYM